MAWAVRSATLRNFRAVEYFSDGLWPRGIGVSCEKETLVSAVLLLFLARRRGFALGVESTGPTETDPQAI
jgi:hypothetical protein